MNTSTKPTLNEAENGNSTKPLLANRFFKFRAMTYKNNIMVYGDLIHTPENDNRIIWFDEKHTYNERVQSSTIGQFTGLKDKNGKEIFEGDILKFMHHLHKVFRVKGGLVINSHLEDFYKDFTPFYEACADMQTSQWIEQCEVIGNIFQNPELLVKANWY